MVEESKGELKSGMAALNLAVNRMARQVELVVTTLPQVVNPRRTDKLGRRPAQDAVGRPPATDSQSDSTSQGDQRGFRVPRIKERSQENQDSEDSLSEVEEIDDMIMETYLTR